MKERTVVHWLAKRLHLKLSGVVGLITTGWLAVHQTLVKGFVVPRLGRSSITSWACLPVEIFSLQAVVTGYIISLAASDLLAERTVSLLGKRRDGSIDVVRYALFMPYHIGLSTKLRLERSQTGASAEAPYNKIADRLYLGGWPAYNALLPPLPPQGTLAVCDVTAELPRRVRLAPEEYMVVPVWDSHAPSTSEIEVAVNWSLGKLEDGHAVYVHCAHGHGRSAVIAGGILIALGRASNVAEAVDMMKKERPLVRLNTRQLVALEAWAASRRRGKKRR